MVARLSTSILLAAALLASSAIAGAQATAPAIYLCLGSNSTNLTPALYTACAGNGTTQNASPVLSLSFGVSETTSVGGVSAGKVVMSNVTLLKLVDDTSVKLAKTLFAGQVFTTLAIGVTVQGSGGAGTGNVTIVLTNAVVTSLYDSGSAGGGAMTENVSFAFKGIKVIDNTTSPPTITARANP
jgi:hypothetical protein